MKDIVKELNDYQKRAMSTRMDNCDNSTYMLLGLCGEVGELLGKIAKYRRKNKLSIVNDKIVNTEIYEEEKIDIAHEIGDVLWFVAGVADCIGKEIDGKSWRLNGIAQMNLDKLSSRKVRGVIDGNGDNR